MCVTVSASLLTCAGANGLCSISASSPQRMRCEGNGLLGNIVQEATFILLQTNRKKSLTVKLKKQSRIFSLLIGCLQSSISCSQDGRISLSQLFLT